MNEQAKRVEYEFHEQIWGVANDWMRCERAIAEARDFAYYVLRDDVDSSLLRDLANRWLDEFGRNPLKERAS